MTTPAPTRERLVTEAMRLFSISGFEATSVSAIEAAAGLAPGALLLVDQATLGFRPADGEKVFGGTITAGVSRKFEARKTFSITLGNAGGVRVSIDGRPLAPLGRPGQVVRNIVLPDSPSRG